MVFSRKTTRQAGATATGGETAGRASVSPKGTRRLHCAAARDRTHRCEGLRGGDLTTDFSARSALSLPCGEGTESSGFKAQTPPQGTATFPSTAASAQSGGNMQIHTKMAAAQLLQAWLGRQDACYEREAGGQMDLQERHSSRSEDEECRFRIVQRRRRQQSLAGVCSKDKEGGRFHSPHTHRQKDLEMRKRPPLLTLVTGESGTMSSHMETTLGVVE
ncbi:hypothetical protein QTO34_009968, partial [Cnephaeus nilssonii]